MQNRNSRKIHSFFLCVGGEENSKDDRNEEQLPHKSKGKIYYNKQNAELIVEMALKNEELPSLFIKPGGCCIFKNIRIYRVL